MDMTPGSQIVIGIGGLEVRRGGCIVTYALGSCLGVTVFDAVSGVGGMLHAQLPLAARIPERARENPALFVDRGLTLLVERAIALGAEKRRLRLTVAGGANITATDNDLFNIARQNLTIMRKILWQLGMIIAAEDTGGSTPRNLSLDLTTGATRVTCQRQTSLL
jgi:chemotaxis protein CheD